jgi:hypothetical protein
MTYVDTNPVAEVRRNRVELLQKYGGIDGLHKYMDEERPELEKQGWRFISVEEILARKRVPVTGSAHLTSGH